MSMALTLKSSCGGCGSTTELYGSNCKHMTLCVNCGKTMAQNRAKCYQCHAPVTRLIREYNVRASSSNDKNYFIGRFVSGLPNFSNKKSAENKWSMQKEGLQGHQLTNAQQDKYKNKPWLLEDETGQAQYHGVLEGSQSATYYLLMMQGKEFVATPASSWYNFNKVAQYKQLTLEEAELKMKNRRRNADGYERWMMKAANNGAAAFLEKDRFDDKESGGGGKGRKKSTDAEDEGNMSDKGEEDPDEEENRESRRGFNKKGGDDNEEGTIGSDLDMDDDDDDIEKGDDWEHEKVFTDDDEAVGNDREDREELDLEIPAPPELKQDDEDDIDEAGGGLSKSGRELKKLIGRAAGLNDLDVEDDDEDMDDDFGDSPVLAPKLKEEPVDSSPAKPAPAASVYGTPSTSMSAKGKRKANGDDVKASGSAATKKGKTKNESKPSAKEETIYASKCNVPTKGTPMSSLFNAPSAAGPVTEEEIRAVLMQKAPLTIQNLVAKFKARVKCQEDKKAFVEIVKRISKFQKTNGPSYVVLRHR